jgi:hypothetical protein
VPGDPLAQPSIRIWPPQIIPPLFFSQVSDPNKERNRVHSSLTSKGSSTDQDLQKEVPRVSGPPKNTLEGILLIRLLSVTSGWTAESCGIRLRYHTPLFEGSEDRPSTSIPHSRHAQRRRVSIFFRTLRGFCIPGIPPSCPLPGAGALRRNVPGSRLRGRGFPAGVWQSPGIESWTLEDARQRQGRGLAPSPSSAPSTARGDPGEEPVSRRPILPGLSGNRRQHHPTPWRGVPLGIADCPHPWEGAGEERQRRGRGGGTEGSAPWGRGRRPDMICEFGIDARDLGTVAMRDGMIDAPV